MVCLTCVWTCVQTCVQTWVCLTVITNALPLEFVMVEVHTEGPASLVSIIDAYHGAWPSDFVKHMAAFGEWHSQLGLVRVQGDEDWQND